MAVTVQTEHALTEPTRGQCECCGQPVLLAVVAGSLILAQPYEWEPRARCYVCQTVNARGQARPRCDRCGGTGYVGSDRPSGTLLAIDVAWGDDAHVRLVGPRTKRRRGEGCYELHVCA